MLSICHAFLGGYKYTDIVIYFNLSHAQYDQNTPIGWAYLPRPEGCIPQPSSPSISIMIDVHVCVEGPHITPSLSTQTSIYMTN